MFTKTEFRLLWPFYLFHVCMGLFFVTVPFFVVYYQSRGLSLAQIASLWAFMSLARLIFELPTGVVADVFGRKISVIIGFFGANLFWMLIPLTWSYESLLAVVICIAICQTFITGAFDAWAYDWLKFNHAKNFAKHYFAKKQFFTLVGAVIGPLIGAVLATQMPLGYLWFIEGAGGILITFILVFYAKEHFVRHKANLTQHARKLMKTTIEGVLFTFKHHQLALLTIASLSLGGWMVIEELAQQPLLVSLGMSVPSLGVFVSILSVAIALVSLGGLWFFGHVKEKTLFVILSSVMLVLGMSLVLAKNYLLAGAILIGVCMLFFMQLPLLTARMNHLIPSRIRATIGSAQSVLTQVMYIAVILAGGWIVDIVGPQTGLVLASLFFIPGIIAFALMKK